MAKALLLIIVLCLLGAPLAQADTDAPANDSSSASADAQWQTFDDLVAGAKASMMGDPEQALHEARIAEGFAQKQLRSPRQTEGLATSLWLEAEALSRTNHIPDARIAIDKAIALTTGEAAVSNLGAHLALSLAWIADAGGDIALALRSFHKAHDIFERLGDARDQAMTLQGLGHLYDEAHDFNREIEYNRQATQVYSGDPALELTASNNAGYALQELGRYNEAITDYRRALDLSVVLKSTFLETQVLTNLANVYAKQHRFGDAQTAADRALRLIGPWDASGEAPFAWGVKAEIEYEQGNLDQAAEDLDRAFRGIDLTTTIALFRDMHEIAYKVYRERGDAGLALAHLEAFKRLDDQGRTLAASANLALTAAQFDFAAQRYEIEHLKSEQLKRDISLRESQAATQMAMYSALILISILLVVWVSLRNLAARKHRDAITKANIALTETLAERDSEIARRTEVEKELRDAKDAAEQANRAKAQFLANMSHELRTPLNAIIGFSEMISQEALGPIGNGSYRNYGADIHVSGRHLLAILNDILDMARIDAGKAALAESELSLDDVVEDALRVLGKETLRNKTLSFVATAPDIRVRADERMLRQIVINLVSNSLKFTPENGVVEVRAVPVRDGVDIVVRDNGIGIPEDKLELVMEPFGQADDAFVRSRGGIGLGLPIVKSLVELHGGRFTLASRPDQGTTARVHLPAARVLGAAPVRQALAS